MILHSSSKLILFLLSLSFLVHSFGQPQETQETSPQSLELTSSSNDTLSHSNDSSNGDSSSSLISYQNMTSYSTSTLSCSTFPDLITFLQSASNSPNPVLILGSASLPNEHINQTSITHYHILSKLFSQKDLECSNLTFNCDTKSTQELIQSENTPFKDLFSTFPITVPHGTSYSHILITDFLEDKDPYHLQLTLLRAYKYLIPGGTLSIIAKTPYTKESSPSFLQQFQSSKSSSPFPGLSYTDILSLSSLSDSELNALPRLHHLFDHDTLIPLLLKLNLSIESISYISREDLPHLYLDGKEYLSIIAKKPLPPPPSSTPQKLSNLKESIIDLFHKYIY